MLSDGDEVRVQAGADGVQFLFLAAKPLREPVVQYGPFVMNTREEIEQAIADYRERATGYARPDAPERLRMRGRLILTAARVRSASAARSLRSSRTRP